MTLAAGTVVIGRTDAVGVSGGLPAPEFEVLNSVVISNAVDVVDPLVSFEESPEVTFHDKAMLQNASLVMDCASRVGVVRRVQLGVSESVDATSTRNDVARMLCDWSARRNKHGAPVPSAEPQVVALIDPLADDAARGDLRLPAAPAPAQAGGNDPVGWRGGGLLSSSPMANLVARDLFFVSPMSRIVGDQLSASASTVCRHIQQYRPRKV